MRRRSPKSLGRFSKKVLSACLKETKNYYRPFDPGLYLYNLVLDVPFEKKFSERFIELVYVTLSAWNMNSRGARLERYEQFRDSLVRYKKEISRIKDERIEEITNQETIGTLSDLFRQLDVVEEGKPPLVTFSKTLHFYLPNLVAPIDRKYTLSYFYGHVGIPRRYESQFNMFEDIERQYGEFAQENDLESYLDEKWNRNVPKILDNMIIGYVKREEKEKLRRIVSP